jgi:signal peptidase I
MIITFALLIFILGLLLNALILNLIVKKLKSSNANYRNALKISFIEKMSTGLIGVIMGIILAGVTGNIITVISSFIIFNLLCRKVYKTKLRQNIFIYLILNFIIVVLSFSIILPVRAFIAQPFYISGASMSPVINDGDYVIFKLFDKNYKRGDIIVHKDPKNEDFIFLGRVIGLPGEKIQIKDASVYIYNDLNPSGEILKEDYLPIDTKSFALDENIFTLGSNQYYILGDNREQSKDSRVYGPVNKDLIIGQYWFIGMLNK